MKRIDLIGMAMLVSCLSFLIVGLNMGGQPLSWSSPTILGFFAASSVSLVLFIIAEHHAELPVVPLYVFTQWKWRNVPIIMSMFFAQHPCRHSDYPYTPAVRILLFFPLFVVVSELFSIVYYC
jgi:hypothetical protein